MNPGMAARSAKTLSRRASGILLVILAQCRKRRGGEHLIEVAHREHTAIAIPHDRPQDVVDASPAEPAQHCDQRHAAEADGLVAQALKAEGFIARRPTVVSPLALQQCPQGVSFVIDDEIRRRCHCHFKALGDLGLIVRTSADIGDAVLDKQRFHCIFDEVFPARTNRANVT